MDGFNFSIRVLINRNAEQALTEFLEYAGVHFTGYDLYLGFPKRNTNAISALIFLFLTALPYEPKRMEL